jgi:hypothetical protein
MGNESSANEGEQETAASISKAFATAETATGSSTTALNQRPRAGSISRRIIKPTHPKLDVHTSDAELPKDNDENEKDENHNGRPQVIPHHIAESPSVARELEQEKAEQGKKERRQTVTERQRTKREKELQERRNNPRKSQTETASTAVTMNPMSRFLSVFSVEAKHPEHKRAFETSPSDIDDFQEPEKKRRATENDDGDDYDELSSAKKNTLVPLTINATLVAAAVAAAAILVGLALRSRRG